MTARRCEDEWLQRTRPGARSSSMVKTGKTTNFRKVGLHRASRYNAREEGLAAGRAGAKRAQRALVGAGGRACQ